MMKRKKFLDLLSKKLSGQIALDEIEQLDRAIRDSEEYKFISEKLDDYFQKRANSETNTEQLHNVWKTIRVGENEDFDTKFNYKQPTKGSSVFKNLLKVAAVLIVLFGVGMLGYHLPGNKAGQNSNLVTTEDGKTFRVLDDGTKIWLNKNSRLSYNGEFGRHKREIVLEGEAYFDVVKNKNIPLFIRAGNIDIEVKGTAFNVNAYKGSPQIRVALVRGLIQVTDRLDKRKVLLHPNEKLIYNNSQNMEQHEFLVKSMESEALLNDTRWIADTLIFNKEKLIDLAVRMEKKFNVKIEIHSERLKGKRFSGVFIDENIQQALESLRLSYPLTYTINNRLVVIKDEK